ncbi:hypothetical protein VFPPC_05115 [Pochonia chlamydosporia 170]|uniref:MEI5 protein n=1 Tax=Pochonia chlamydosporia 170 TaxID=1380566 RepID=A0A179FUQ8_METCM|nr:hypothetical protein VFPPC_05115 [Pochonia chlamydosporia 170]OAQ68968.1 hypothetical protein VFPPC_05115 [Pochonia chlamydosporia 170]
MAHPSFKERMKTLTTMAESKVKAAAKGPINRNLKDSKLWSLICLAREVSVDTEGIQDYGQLVSDKKSLEHEVSEKSTEIARLKEELAHCKDMASTEKSFLMREFGEQYKKFSERTDTLEINRGRVEQLETELETMKDRNKSQRDKLVSMDRNAKATQSEFTQLEKDMVRTQRDCTIHRSELQAAQEKCADLEARLRTDLGHDAFHDIDVTRVEKLRDSLKSLARESYAILKEFMSDAEQAMTHATPLQNLQGRFPLLPLPTGLTKEAVLMRRAAGQAVICEALMAHIFRPFYISDDLKESAYQMLEFFSEDKEQQQIYRHQVLRIIEDEETEPTVEPVMNAGSAIFMALDRLVPSARLEEFRHKIERFLNRAAQMWVIEAQHASDLIEVMTPGTQNEPPETCQEYGVRNVSNAGTSNHDVAATLFPRIAVRGQTLHVGQVVWSDSPAALIAKDQIPSTTLGRAATVRRNGRRNSVAARPAA